MAKGHAGICQVVFVCFVSAIIYIVNKSLLIKLGLPEGISRYKEKLKINGEKMTMCHIIIIIIVHPGGEP